MTLDQLINLLAADLLPLLVKGILLFVIFLYGVFAAVIARQVQLMNKVVTEVGFSPVLFTVAILHFLAVVALFILAIVLL